MKEKGSPEVAFRVAMKDGKVAFTARAMKGQADKNEEVRSGRVAEVKFERMHPAPRTGAG